MVCKNKQIPCKCGKLTHTGRCHSCANRERPLYKWNEQSKIKIRKEGNNFWKGDKIQYEGLHSWIRNNKPKTNICNCCKQINKSKRSLDLANISQKYKRDINDYEWLCRKCHMTKDGRLEVLKKTHVNHLYGGEKHSVRKLFP